MNELSPKFRFKLKARIIEVGYRSLTEFSVKVPMDLALTSRIVNGWVYPSPRLAQKMADLLGLSIREFQDLL